MSTKIAAVKIKIDAELVAILEADGRSLEDSTREHLVLDLYRQGSLSDRSGARLLGIGLEEFIRWAAERGVPYIRYPASDLDRDIEVAMKAARRPE